ncbi:hypothetical protein J3E68DRAFT_409978 [Trichoderma sp. SZMC 28012]
MVISQYRDKLLVCESQGRKIEAGMEHELSPRSLIGAVRPGSFRPAPLPIFQLPSSSPRPLKASIPPNLLGLLQATPKAPRSPLSSFTRATRQSRPNLATSAFLLFCFPSRRGFSASLNATLLRPRRLQFAAVPALHSAACRPVRKSPGLIESSKACSANGSLTHACFGSQAMGLQGMGWTGLDWRYHATKVWMLYLTLLYISFEAGV